MNKRTITFISLLVLIVLVTFPVTLACRCPKDVQEAYFKDLDTGKVQDAVSLIKKYPCLAQAKNSESVTTLMASSYIGDIELCRLLVESGADVNARTTEECQVSGVTPLIVASGRRNLDVVEYLLKNGAEINAKDSNQNTPLHIACAEGDSDMCKLLLQRGANINASNKFGDTPLMVAISYYHDETASFLVHNGANVFKAGVNGVTPLHKAAEMGMLGTCKLLIANEAEIDARDHRMWTPLTYATQNDHKETVKMLIDAGADVDIKDKEGNTALYIAKKFDSTGAIPLLKKAMGITNSFGEAGRVLDRYLELDTFGSRIGFGALDDDEISALGLKDTGVWIGSGRPDAEEIPDLVMWKEKPHWRNLVIITNAKMVSKKELAPDRVKIKVIYHVLGTQEGDRFTWGTKDETVDFILQKQKDSKKYLIASPEIPPHVNIKVLESHYYGKSITFEFNRKGRKGVNRFKQYDKELKKKIASLQGKGK